MDSKQQQDQSLNDALPGKHLPLLKMLTKPIIHYLLAMIIIVRIEAHTMNAIPSMMLIVH